MRQTLFRLQVSGADVLYDYSDYYLLDKIDTSEQVHSKIDESPVDALLLVLLLFEYEHVVVKELLEFLVREVNAELLETVVLL